MARRASTRWILVQRRAGIIGFLARGCRPLPPPPTERLVRIQQPEAEEHSVALDNTVVTSRYNAVTFVPIFLLQQFCRLANFYFLCIVVLQLIPEISITSGVPTTAIPLAFVLTFDGAVTAWEDWKRHLDDDKTNNRRCEVMRGGKLEPLPCRDVRVGDVVRVAREEEFPADCVMLQAQHADPSQRGLCHVQTSQLDGETNLKLRRAPDGVPEQIEECGGIGGLRGTVRCEPPNPHFNRFSGILYLTGCGGAAAHDDGTVPEDGSARGIPLDAGNTLLRGCTLRNADFVYGVVVFTGQETKVRVSQRVVHGKSAAVEREVTRYILWLVVFQLALCAAGAVGFAIWGQTQGVNAWYLLNASPTAEQAVQRFFTYVLLLSSIVPISLYVSMRLARVAQKYFLESDAKCVYVAPPPNGGKAADGRGDAQGGAGRGGGEVYPLRVRSMELNDELGQITHVFADKTGTLTSNYMEFRLLHCRGVTYGLGTTEIGLARRRRAGMDTGHLEQLAARAADLASSGARESPHVLFIDGVEGEQDRCLLGPQGDLDGEGASRDPGQSEALRMLLLHLALNHTVIKESVHDPDTGAVTGEQLSASSPDEEAFVLAAGHFGYAFVGRAKDVVTLNVRGRGETHYRVVAVLPYSNARKMMSVLVEDIAASSRGDEAGAFTLFSKGADSKILSKLDPAGTDSEVVSSTVEAMAEMARDGLRTLCFASRTVEPSGVDAWLDDFAAAVGDLEQKQRKAAGQPNAIDELMDQLETGLTLQGATANEDKLQDEVPATCALLAAAGIKLYMLTGDKVETAINIAFAARLLAPEFELTELTADRLRDPAGEAPGALAARADEIRALAARGLEPSAPLALIVDEVVLDIALQGRENRRNFLTVAEACRTVVCARSRPDQKKRVVELVKRGLPSSRTLAIGDGANDVDMIQTSHVGVGIAGAEGLQAANASDYAIGRFRFLQRLLLVHGRWNYARMATLISYSFYKNLLWSFSLWLFSIWAGWSGQRSTIEAFSQTFNLLYSGLPILVVAVLDQDVSGDLATKMPFLYSDGLLKRRLNTRVLVLWLGSALAEGAIAFFLLLFCATEASYDGTTPYLFEWGTYLTVAVLLLINVRLALVAHRHDWILIASIAGSCLLIILCAWLFDAINFDRMRGGMRYVWGSPTFWLYLTLAVAATQIPFSLFHWLRRYLAPEYRDVIQEYNVLVRPSRPDGRRGSYQRCCTCGMRKRTTTVLPDGEALLQVLRGERAPSPERPVRTAVRVDASRAHELLDAIPEERAVPSTAPALPQAQQAGAAAAASEASLVPRTAGRDSAPRRRPEPELAFIYQPCPNPRYRLAHRRDWATLPYPPDSEAELTEWPYEQRILRSLRSMAAADAPVEAVLARRNALVKARLASVVERAELRARAPGTPAPEAAAAVPTVGAAPAPAPEGEVRLVVGRAREVVEPGKREAAAAAAAAAAEYPAPAALPPAAARPPPVPRARVRAATMIPLAELAAERAAPSLHRRTGTDFDIDVGHADLLGQLQSSLGLWQTRTSRASAPPPGGPRRLHVAISQPAVPLRTYAQMPLHMPADTSLEAAAATALALGTPPPETEADLRRPPAAAAAAAVGSGSRRRRAVIDTAAADLAARQPAAHAGMRSPPDPSPGAGTGPQ